MNRDAKTLLIPNHVSIVSHSASLGGGGGGLVKGYMSLPKLGSTFRLLDDCLNKGSPSIGEG